MSIKKLTLEASGLKIKVWAEYERNPPDDSIAIKIPDLYEPIYLSPTEAQILGLVLLSLGKREDM